MLDPKYEPMKIPRLNFDETMFTALRSHGGFGNEGKDLSSYGYSRDYDLDGILGMYKSYTVVSAAPQEEKQKMLLEMEQELRSNPDAKDNENYRFQFILEMHWFQKL